MNRASLDKVWFDIKQVKFTHHFSARLLNMSNVKQSVFGPFMFVNSSPTCSNKYSIK